MSDKFDRENDEKARQERVSERRHLATGLLCMFTLVIGLSMGIILGQSYKATTNGFFSPEPMIPAHKAVAYPACTLKFC